MTGEVAAGEISLPSGVSVVLVLGVACGGGLLLLLLVMLLLTKVEAVVAVVVSLASWDLFGMRTMALAVAAAEVAAHRRGCSLALLSFAFFSFSFSLFSFFSLLLKILQIFLSC